MSAEPLYKESYRAWFAPLLIFLPPLLPLFWTYEIAITKDELRFGYRYWLTSATVKRSRVRKAEPIAHVNGLTGWGGWGIRTNLRWETGYIVKNGPAVRVAVLGGDGEREKGGQRVYVFSCEEPERVSRILNEV